MEFLDKETLTLWLVNYGSIALFFLLALGILALPIPDETLIVLSGVLIKKGYLYFFPTLIAACLGSISGITLSYLIGTSGGHYILEKYGGWIGFNEKKKEQLHNWVERFGKWTLFFGYFIPGVRHFTGITTGTMGLQYSHFALFAYSGALIWVLTFLSFGYFFSDYCMRCLELEITFGQGATVVIVGIALFFVIKYLYKKRQKKG